MQLGRDEVLWVKITNEQKHTPSIFIVLIPELAQ